MMKVTSKDTYRCLPGFVYQVSTGIYQERQDAVFSGM